MKKTQRARLVYVESFRFCKLFMGIKRKIIMARVWKSRCADNQVSVNGVDIDARGTSIDARMTPERGRWTLNGLVLDSRGEMRLMCDSDEFLLQETLPNDYGLYIIIIYSNSFIGYIYREKADRMDVTQFISIWQFVC